MAINPAIPASPSLAAAISGQPAFRALGDHPPEAAPAPAPVPVTEAQRPRANASAEAQASLVASAYQRTEGPPQARASSRIQVIAAANRQIDKYVEAEKAGVKLAKATFIKKLAEVAVHVAIVGIAVAVKCGSFGLLAPVTTPVIALTGANLAVAAGDAYCCYKNWQAAKSQAAGGDKQRMLGGDSIISHALMKAARGTRSALIALGVREQRLASVATTDKIAKGVSIGFKVGLACATSFYTAGLTGAGAAKGATDAMKAGADLAKVGFLVTNITGAAMNLLTTIQRGCVERQFLGQSRRSDRQQDLYQGAIPRQARGLQRMNSIANDSTRLMIGSPRAFRNAIAAGAPDTRSPARMRAALLLTRTFEGDANNLRRAGQGRGDVVINESRARAFASVAQGTAEDFGNAFVSTGKFAMTGGAIVAGHFGWIQDAKNLVGL